MTGYAGFADVAAVVVGISAVATVVPLIMSGRAQGKLKTILKLTSAFMFVGIALVPAGILFLMLDSFFKLSDAVVFLLAVPLAIFYGYLIVKQPWRHVKRAVSAPGYEWNCLACSNRNAGAQALCARCGCPSNASKKEAGNYAKV